MCSWLHGLLWFLPASCQRSPVVTGLHNNLQRARFCLLPPSSLSEGLKYYLKSWKATKIQCFSTVTVTVRISIINTCLRDLLPMLWLNCQLRYVVRLLYVLKLQEATLTFSGEVDLILSHKPVSSSPLWKRKICKCVTEQISLFICTHLRKVHLIRISKSLNRRWFSWEKTVMSAFMTLKSVHLIQFHLNINS